MPARPGIQFVNPLLITNLASGLELTVATIERDVDDLPVADNKLYNDGTPWGESDQIDSGWAGATQVVLDQADVETTGTPYKTFDVNIPVQVSYALDDSINKPSWLSTWQDAGRDHIIGNDTLSLFVKEFPAGTITLGGNSGTATDAMGVCLVKPGYSREPNIATTGKIQFEAASYSGDDNGATIIFTCTRTGGTVGAASAAVSITTDTAPGSTLNTTSVAWSDGDATSQTGTVTTANLSGDGFLILGLGTFVGATEGSRSATTLNVTDTGTTPTAQTYYVDTATGNDADDGESFNNAWKTIAKANNVQPVAGGDVVIFVEGGTYTDDPIVPVNAGTDSTHRIIWKPRTSDVTLKGPSGTNINYGIDLTVQYLEVVRDSTFQFIVDGDADKVQGSYPGGNIQLGGRMSADNCVAEYRHQETMGYSGMTITGDTCILRVESLQHGTTDKNGSGSPTGDTVIIKPTNGPTLVDGEGAGAMKASGHNLIRMDSGTGIMRHVHIDNDWEDVGAPFIADEGWRGGTCRSTKRWACDDCIMEHGGQDVIGGGEADGFRFGDGGQDHAACRFFFLNSKGNGLDLNADGTNGHRFSHLLFYNNEEAHINLRKSTGGIQDWVNGAKITNSIFGNNPLIANGSSDDVLIKFHPSLTDAEEDLFEFFGNLVPLDAYVYFRNTRMLLSFAETTYPNVFHDNVVDGPNWVSAPSSPTFSNVYSGFATNSGSPARNIAGDLTTASGAGASSTTLSVLDAGYFPDPLGFVSPTVGPASGGYQVFLEGVGLVTYTSITLAPSGVDTITLSSAKTWDNGAAVNLPFTGAGPDMGPVQS